MLAGDPSQAREPSVSSSSFVLTDRKFPFVIVLLSLAPGSLHRMLPLFVLPRDREKTVKGHHPTLTALALPLPGRHNF